MPATHRGTKMSQPAVDRQLRRPADVRREWDDSSWSSSAWVWPRYWRSAFSSSTS